MRVVTLHMPKGGAGRTTTTLVLASAFAAAGARVLVLEAARRGQLPFWGPWFAAQDPACPLARRIFLARAEAGRALTQITRRAAREGFDVCLVDAPRAAPERREPLLDATLAEAELILLPYRNGWEAQIARREVEQLVVDHAAVVLVNAEATDLPRLRAAWSGTPERLLRAALPHRTLRGRLTAWPHALHAQLLAREHGRWAEPTAAPLSAVPPRGAAGGALEPAPGADLTARLAAPVPDLARLEALEAVVDDANRLAAEVRLRLEGWRLVPLTEPDEDWSVEPEACTRA